MYACTRASLCSKNGKTCPERQLVAEGGPGNVREESGIELVQAILLKPLTSGGYDYESVSRQRDVTSRTRHAALFVT